MTFQDIFQSSFLSRVSSVSPLDMGLALGLAFLLGLFIFLIYKKSYSGVMYSPSFGVTLITLALITTLLILAVSSNVVLSLGMVGALSIVRFRTAIKEPMDIAFLFWSIAVGIVLAAGFSSWRCWAAPLWAWCCGGLPGGGAVRAPISSSSTAQTPKPKTPPRHWWTAR